MSGRRVFGTAVAAVLCGAMLFSAGIVTGRHTVKVNTSENTVAMKTVATYGDIYNNIKKFKTTFWDKIRNYTSDDTEIIEEAYDGAMNGSAATGTNGSNLKSESAAADTDNSADHSDTNVQVEGVDEADVVKTDGKYIYILSFYERRVKIVDVTGEKPRQLTSIKTEDIFNCDMYLSGGRLILLGEGNSEKQSTATAVIYDISDPNKPKELTRLKQSGNYQDSRLIDGRLYMISNFTINSDEITKGRAESYVPSVSCKDYNGAVAAESVHFYNNCNYPQYTVISSYDMNGGEIGRAHV